MINVAVVGCGYWGPNLLRNLYSLPGCKLRWVCDARPERLAHMKRLYHDVPTTERFEEVINDPQVDAVVIATPVRFHFEQVSQSLQAGKHTFVEKPMAASVAECQTLNRLAADGNLTLMVGHTFVYTAEVRKVKEIMDSGELGPILYLSSRRLNLGLFQKDINVAWDLAPHDISIMLYVLPDLPISVNCQGKAHVAQGIEDVTNMSLTFKNGGFAIVQSSWLEPTKVREMTIVGSQKMLVYNDVEPLEKIKIYDKRVETPPHYDTFAEFQYSYHYGDMFSPYLSHVEPLRIECQHFLDCIESGAKPDSSGLEGMQVVQILEAASESLQKGGCKIDIAPLD